MADINKQELSTIEKKVLNYIKTYQSKGYSPSEIQKALTKSGVDSATIKKCMQISGVSKPLYKNKILWGVLLGLLILFITVMAIISLTPDYECASDSDCRSGYDCSSNECVAEEEEAECSRDSECDDDEECDDGECVYVAEEEEEDDSGIEPQCGDGECNIGEDCVADCGCDSDSDCDSGEEWNSDDECVSSSSGGYEEEVVLGGTSSDPEEPSTDTTYPNLFISNLETTSLTTNTMLIDVTVGNEDLTTDETFVTTCTIYENDSTEYDANSIDISGLDAGTTETITCSLEIVEFSDQLLEGAESVTVTLEIFVDSGEELAEGYEDDNIFTEELTWVYTDFFEETSTTTETASTIRCADGLDNDGDGLIDLSDRGCTSIEDDDERNACGDSFDNDNDGLIDADDPECSSEADLTEDIIETRCNDGYDNDGDGKIDLADSECTGLTDDDERVGITAYLFGDEEDNSFSKLDSTLLGTSEEEETRSIDLSGPSRAAETEENWFNKLISFIFTPFN